MNDFRTSGMRENILVSTIFIYMKMQKQNEGNIFSHINK